MAVGQILMCLPSKSFLPYTAQISCFSIDEAKHLKIFFVTVVNILKSVPEQHTCTSKQD